MFKFKVLYISYKIFTLHIIFQMCVISNLVIFLTAKNSTNDNDFGCHCMEYWTCVTSGGHPYCYCDLSASSVCCCVALNAKPVGILPFSKQSKSCGKKGADSAKDGQAEMSEWPWHNFGKYDPVLKKYEITHTKPSSRFQYKDVEDGHNLSPHHKVVLLGSGDHDYKNHGKHSNRKHGKKHVLGGDDHDYKRHRKTLLGGDDHDYKAHKKSLLGAGDHDYKKHGKKSLLGAGDHDYKKHGKMLLGSDGHDYKKHGKVHKKKSLDSLPHIAAFRDFTGKYNKTYASEKELRKRFSIFRSNLKKIKIMQQNELGSAKYGITKFADWSILEFRQLLGLKPHLKPSVTNLKPAEIPVLDKPAPLEFDWRKKGVVTPVKNQGMCGSCWAFSVTGNVEGQWALQHNKLFSLSEQELVDCDSTDHGCEGGLPENAYKAIKDLGGLETEAGYPYEGKDDKCQLESKKIKVKVNGSVELPEDEEKMKAWLLKNGPISIGINANALQFYMGGVSHPFKFLCSPDNLDHGMLIVGYGVHTTKYLHRRQPYWLVKNSWGPDWGEKGYYRVFRGDGTCGVNKMATSGVVP